MSGLHVDSVRKHFRFRQVLSDVFISCKKGEVIGLLGRNGSGKSTLLKIIFGSLAAENRFIAIDDIPKNGLFESRGLIGYLPQESFLPGHIKIKSIVSLYCDRNQAAILFDHDLVKPFLGKKSRELSGGERRMIEVLIMIYSTASYLLFDEPFNGIAPIYIEKIKLLIQEHAVKKGFIVTDHDYANILAISSRVIMLHDGAVKKIEGLNDLVDLGYLPEKYDIELEKITFT
ncbi:ATP-binding cassette domain-containing protein [Pedobacter cryoconitis]|uniref:ABC-type lipopolysaccharide export system ATPase subunit n=1 Tax=Pedobacter cryoconitis TaxID=188932 RepID=A0A327RXP4_9SPHI|nr:ATP-binding cassette domain-containing protein [Pedobacter cryoconitis]RAJ21018.1 ABC-type lipopolysaccharide export system ATPase subunit [Pedobacter cryoconitis]